MISSKVFYLIIGRMKFFTFYLLIEILQIRLAGYGKKKT